MERGENKLKKFLTVKMKNSTTPLRPILAATTTSRECLNATAARGSNKKLLVSKQDFNPGRLGNLPSRSMLPLKRGSSLEGEPFTYVKDTSKLYHNKFSHIGKNPFI